MSFLKKHGHLILTIFVAIIFIQSLFFKFTNSPETIYIFEGKLEPWAASLGFSGLFTRGGIASAPVVGSAELVAAIVLLIGAFMAKPLVQTIGAIIGLKVISGAIFFHLFTPLGIAVVNTDGSSDGGALFIMACLVWLSCLAIICLRKDHWLPVVKKLFNK